MRALQGSDEGTSTNSSRNVHRAMERMGYSLPIKVHSMTHVAETADVQTLTSYHIKAEDWIQHWMNEFPELLGGQGNPHDNFEAFWKVYQMEHPGHEVFSQHQDRLRNVVPVILHGDEGRAVKRTNYLVVSFESPIGSLRDPTLKCSCIADLEKRCGLPSYGSDLGAIDSNYVDFCRKQTTNFKGHSYLSRFLLFGIGGWVYKNHPNVFEDLWCEVQKSLVKLFSEGVDTNSGTMFAALIAFKGDMAFQKHTMCLDRSYQNAGTVNALNLCHLCMAGEEDYPFKDYAESPGWLPTQFITRPWSEEDPPTMAGVPFDQTCPERLLQPDIFHIHKLGVARDVIGGVLILLLRLKFFDFPGSTVNIDDRFQRAHSYFALWCRARGKKAGLRSFTKAFFNMKSLISAPWANCKGSDSILLLQWLQFTLKLNIDDPVVPNHECLLKQMLQLVNASLAVRILHHHGLWLEGHVQK